MPGASVSTANSGGSGVAAPVAAAGSVRKQAATTMEVRIETFSGIGFS